MDKPLLKLYIVILTAAAAALLFLPAILGRLSGWATNEITRARLIACAASGAPRLSDEGKGNVIIVMDDGFESQFTRGYPILKQYGMKGCIAVIPAAVGDPDYMDYDQLAELYMAGWDMLNHTYNHEDLAALSAERREKQISEGSGWLKSHALCRGSDILVYPGGYNTDSTPEALKSTGVKAARSLKSVWSSDLGCNLENVEVCNVISWMPFELIKAAVDKAADNCGTVVLVFHKIEPVTNDTQMQVEESRLKEIVEYIASLKDSINVITFSELTY